MHRFRRFAEAVHIVSASLWAGSILMAAVVAAVAFPTMRDLGPTLSAYEAYSGEHWPLAAGAVANRVFMIVDAAQLVLAMLAAGTLVFLAYANQLGGRLVGIVRLLALGIALLTFGVHLFWLRPKMDVDLANYWEAARQGQTETAQEHREGFASKHPTASRLMGATALSALVLGGAGAWGATAPRDKRA